MKILSGDIKGIIPGETRIFDREFIAPADADVIAAALEHIRTRPSPPPPQPELDQKKREWDDCDNRVLKMWAALSGRGWAVGFVAVRGHAVVGYVNDHHELKFIESLDGVLIDQPLTPIFTMMV